MKRATPLLIATLLYLTAVIAANWLSTHYGQVHVWWGLQVSAGTYAAGAALRTSSETPPPPGNAQRRGFPGSATSAIRPRSSPRITPTGS
jgi:hypothetical protein